MPDFADDVPLMPGSRLALAPIVCVSCPYFSHPFDKSSQEIDSCRVSCVPLASVWDNWRQPRLNAYIHIGVIMLAPQQWQALVRDHGTCSYTTPYPDSLSPGLRIARLHPGYSPSAMSKTPSWLSAPLKLCHECTSIPLVRLSLVRDHPCTHSIFSLPLRITHVIFACYTCILSSFAFFTNNFFRLKWRGGYT